MKYFITSIALLVVVTVYGCGSWRPHIGMSFEEWDKQCLKRTWSHGALVGAEGNLEVFYCDHMPNVFYYFEDGILVKVDQGEHYKQRIEVEIKNPAK